MRILMLPSILAAKCYYFLFKPQPPKAKNRSSNREQLVSERKAFRCVVIKPGSTACQTVKGYSDEPILMSEAPALPLAACDQSICQCKFLKYDDRRRDDRRNSLHVARQQIGGGENLREKDDRRK